ncbi:conserved hypothetical protein [Flavobacterium sp. 9AF]|uniref:sensor histidine kinase n=1 Tax=Flavobacterium sp. 9AF TaxID=2653142 RepID=UPI0012F210CC|nr:sensor histidine kinase [Flavobacterium sp. 9AF]VXC39701.1 conserved hypothetical protein [Flavobacterium sp. 9AF]
MKKRLILVFINIISIVVYSQQSNFCFLNFDLKDGLGEKYIYSFAQDKFGSIWLGTGSGLYKFNGKKFLKISSTEDRPGHQINNILQTVYNDSDKLWLSSINAVQIYDLKNKKFTSFDYENPVNERVVKEFVNAFFRDSKGNFWIGTRKGYWYLYDEKNKKCKQFVPKDPQCNENSKFTSKIIETTSGEVWVITFNGIFNCKASGEINSYFNVESDNDYSDGFYDKENNCIWLAGGFDGIVKFDLETRQFHKKQLIEKNSNNSNPANYVTTICRKSKDEFWFGANVLGVYNFKSDSFYTIPETYKDEYSFKTSRISRLYLDKENNLWIPSFKGLSMLSWQNNQIKNIPLFNEIAKYTVEPFGVMLYKKNDFLIANNSSNGLLWWKANEKNLTVIENPLFRGKYRKNHGIVAFAKNSKNEIFGVSENKVFKLNQDTNSLETLSFLNDNSLKNITRIVFDKEDNFYLFSPYNGFYFVNNNTKIIQHYNLIDVDKLNEDVNSNLIAPRIADSQNAIWFTMTEGVYAYQSGKFQHFATEKALNNGAKITQSFDIIEYSANNYWITTQDNGIFNLKLKNGKSYLYNYTQKNSDLPSDCCNRIVKDANGFLWIGTLNGLVKFNETSKKVETILTKQNGLLEDSAAIMMNLLPNNNLIVNYYGTLSVLDISNYKFNKKIPQIKFSSILVLDKEMLILNDNLKLKYNENFITFNWETNALTNFNQNKYAYRLVGVSKDWKETRENSVSFSNLNHGEYIFQVKACNNDGVWSGVIEYQLVVKSPFWETWWFYTVLAIIISAILYGFYYYKLQKIKSEEKLKAQFAQDLAQIEMKALRAQMNPHFIFNSLNSIQKFILKNDTFAASQYLTKFSKLIRLILDHSNQNYIQLSNEIEQLKLYTEIEALRFDNQFDYEFFIDSSLKMETVFIPSMIIQPYIENAIWHGLLHKDTKGKLIVKIAKHHENCIKVEVEDNGIGREKALELKSKQVLKKKSYGMEITNNRIDILNKIENNNTICHVIDLKDVNNLPIGTKVELIIPLKTNHYD